MKLSCDKHPPHLSPDCRSTPLRIPPPTATSGGPLRRKLCSKRESSCANPAARSTGDSGFEIRRLQSFCWTLNYFFYVLRPFSPVLGVGRCLHCRTFWWSGEAFDIRMPFLTTTNDVYVGARTFNLSVENPTRNLYTTVGPLR